MYIERSILSACVLERTSASVLCAPASACALILNICGSEKAKEKEKKIRFDTIGYERQDP